MDEVEKIGRAREAILEELKQRYAAGDKAVRPNTKWSRVFGNEDKSSNYFSGAGTMKCPVCSSGVLRYSRASVNGHVWARCSTDGCVAWME